MPKKEAKMEKRRSTNGVLEFADKLWDAANRLRGRVEAAQYKHFVLPLIFLKYLSDAFEERRKWLAAAVNDPQNEDYYVPSATEEEVRSITEDKDEYLSAYVFFVPEVARWQYLLARAAQPDIGRLINQAMIAIEKENPNQLRGVLPKVYAAASIPPETLGELVNLFSTIGFGDREAVATDALGRTYEYFIQKFAEAEGKGGGEFYTPRSVVRLLVGMLEPYEGRVYDPACGSGGMFVQSRKFIERHNGRGKGIAIYGQESVEATWRICRMNLAIRHLEGAIELGDTLHDDRFKDLKADFIITNPPFNMKRWGADKVQGDVRLKYGQPPDSNANYMWIQHYIHHLAPNGRAGFVMANGSLSVGGREGEMRRRIIEADLVTAWSRCRPSCSSRRGYPRAYGSSLATKMRSGRASGTARARRSSSTPGNWASWSTGRTATSRKRKSPGSRGPTARGRARRTQARTRTPPGFAGRQSSTRSQSTASS